MVPTLPSSLPTRTHNNLLKDTVTLNSPVVVVVFTFGIVPILVATRAPRYANVAVRPYRPRLVAPSVALVVAKLPTFVARPDTILRPIVAPSLPNRCDFVPIRAP